MTCLKLTCIQSRKYKWTNSVKKLISMYDSIHYVVSEFHLHAVAITFHMMYYVVNAGMDHVVS